VALEGHYRISARITLSKKDFLKTGAIRVDFPGKLASVETERSISAKESTELDSAFPFSA
jgi:hypothetical protein